MAVHVGPYTAVYQASAHGRSQLKQQKMRVGSCMQEVLEYLKYPVLVATGAAREPNRPSLLLCLCFVEGVPC